MREPRAYLAPVPFLAILGAGISGFLVANHYAYLSADFCSVASWLDCNEVNQSAWSEILGIPVAAIGLAGFLVLLVLALDLRLREAPRFRPWQMLALAAVGVAFGLYLLGVELLALHLFCLLCLVSLVLGITILAFTALAFWSDRRGTRAPVRPEPAAADPGPKTDP